MFSSSATAFMEHLRFLYKQTGKNEFNLEDYVNIENHGTAIKELTEKGMLNESKNILQTLSINFDNLKR